MTQDIYQDDVLDALDRAGEDKLAKRIRKQIERLAEPTPLEAAMAATVSNHEGQPIVPLRVLNEMSGTDLAALKQRDRPLYDRSVESVLGGKDVWYD